MSASHHMELCSHCLLLLGADKFQIFKSSLILLCSFMCNLNTNLQIKIPMQLHVV